MSPDLRSAWDRVAPALETIPFAEERVRYAAAIQPILTLPRDAAVLEVGCGSGRILRAIEALGFTTPIGLELSMERLLQARRRGTGRSRLVCASGLPFASDSFDAVVSAAVLEHVEHPRAWLHDLARVTRRKGIVSIVTDTYMWKWLKSIGLYRPIQPIDQAIHPDQIINWARERGLRLLQCGGFVNIPAQRFFFLKTLLRSIPGLLELRRLLRRGPAAPREIGSDDPQSVLSALQDFAGVSRPGNRNCVWSYECFYWFEKI